MSEIKIGDVIVSENLSKNHEKVEKIVYKPLFLGTQDKQISTEKEYYENHLHSKYFGLATHYCLEMMDQFNKNSLKYCINLAKSRYSNYLDSNDFERIELRILNLINDPVFTELIKDSQFISEQAIIYKEEVKIIDLLLYKNDSYYILDYKTTKEKHAEHKVQVNHYKKAISEIFDTSNVYTYLVYMSDDLISIDEVK